MGIVGISPLEFASSNSHRSNLKIENLAMKTNVAH